MTVKTNVAWIKTVDETEATGKVKEVYEFARGRTGYVGNIVKVHSIKPELMEAYQAFSHKVTFGGTSLGRHREEMVAVLVSALLKCRYWTISHGEFLCEVGEGATKKLMLELKEDWRKAGVDGKDMAMLEYAEKITLNPSSITERDVENLRSHGWTDTEILEIACLASYRNYIARVANALGVISEEHHFADDLETRERLAEGLK